MVLGHIHEQGLGVKQDMAKALAYYDAAKQDLLNGKWDPFALFKIGQYLEEGAHPECYGGQPNREVAL